MNRDQAFDQIAALHHEAFRALQSAKDLMAIPTDSMEAAFATTRNAVNAQREAIDALLAANRVARDLMNR